MGQEAKTIMRPIPLDKLLCEMKMSMLQNMKAFEDATNQPLNFWNSQFGQSFAVLTCCRILHTVHTGTIQSKKAGAKWAKQHVRTQMGQTD